MNEELMTKEHIRYNLTDQDMKFFTPNHTKCKESAKHVARNEFKMEEKTHKRAKKEPVYLKFTRSMAIWVLICAVFLSGLGGIRIGMAMSEERYTQISHWQESLIRSEAIADYKAMVEAEEAEEAALRMAALKDEATIKKEMAISLAKMFEGVRAWNFDILDLITYGTCALNRVRSPLFADSFDDVIHQSGQWINYSDENDVVDDYYKIAVKLVDLYYNSEVQLCSSKYCWIEIRDGHVYLKDSYTPYVGMILWRYSGEV